MNTEMVTEMVTQEVTDSNISDLLARQNQKENPIKVFDND